LLVPRRPPVFVLALTVGDYLLWNWSLNGGHDVLALVSGLTLPPLALISFWLLAITAMRTVAAGARALRVRRAARAASRAAGPRPAARPRTAASGAPRTAERTAAAEQSRRIAA
jgi:hypothetical protein